METIHSLLYGVAYYDEYMPYDRIDQDMQMMRKAGINVIRIAESTWATEEPENGIFDFTHVIRALEAAKRYGLFVIVGTPTYAFPPWLAAENPEVLAVTEKGRAKYGPRQNMDITSPAYRFYAERIIRKLMACVQPYSNVIGFQLDNETKHFHTAGPAVQKGFVKYLRDTFGTVESLNREFGFNYWSNRVDSWENVPDVTGAINASFMAEFEKYRRSLVNDFLTWQSNIVREYLRDDQFITHNFDYEWRDYSFGIQPDVNHKEAAEALTIAGCDIYHLSQQDLTGKEIAFGGDVCRGLKQDNYLVIETQAQGHVAWTPFPGQLRLQAFSHLASGANAVMYWHWHSIHNAMETYWRGLLSHNLEENDAYREACTIGADFQRLSPRLLNLKKKNRVAILVSNESLTALDLFRLPDNKTNYNDIVRWLYDALYTINVETDILFPQDVERLSDYAVLLVPAMYSASETLLDALQTYTKNGGHLFATFKTGFANEYLTVYPDNQPHKLTECFGVTYDTFTQPVHVSLIGDDFPLEKNDRTISTWMELLRPITAKTISVYDHPAWASYSAVTENKFGSGSATYLGCLTKSTYLQSVLLRILQRAGVQTVEQTARFPIAIKNGKNQFNRQIHYYFNYSEDAVKQPYLHNDAIELLSGIFFAKGETLKLDPWDVKIFEEN